MIEEAGDLIVVSAMHPMPNLDFARGTGAEERRAFARFLMIRKLSINALGLAPAPMPPFFFFSSLIVFVCLSGPSSRGEISWARKLQRDPC